jgi:hypothetical protein
MIEARDSVRNFGNSLHTDTADRLRSLHWILRFCVVKCVVRLAVFGQEVTRAYKYCSISHGILYPPSLPFVIILP